MVRHAFKCWHVGGKAKHDQRKGQLVVATYDIEERKDILFIKHPILIDVITASMHGYGGQSGNSVET